MAVIDSIEELLKLAKIPNSLEGFGFKDSDIQGFCNFRSQVDGAFKMNPIEIDDEDLITKILN